MANFLCTKTGVELRVYKNGSVYAKGSRKKYNHYIDSENYPYVSIKKDGKRCNHRIHRLLGLLFIPNPNKLPFINHLDTNKRNHKLSNLEWSSVSENTKHAVDNGCMDHIKRRGESHIASKYSFQKVQQIRETYNGGGVSINRLAKEFEMSRSYVSDVVNLRKRVEV